MYYDFLVYILDQIKKYNNITDDKILPLNSTIEKINDYRIRPNITYGDNSDWSNIRRDEDFIITLQFFVEHGNYLDLNYICRDVKQSIIKYCSSKAIDKNTYSINRIGVSTSFESAYNSISLNLYINVKEII